MPKNKKNMVTDLLGNIYTNTNKEVTAVKTRVPISDILNSVSANITVAMLQAEDDSAEPSYTNITDAGKQGIFWYDSTDVTAADDGGAACIVTTTGKRYKRVIQKGIDARWYGQTNYYFPDVTTATTAVKTFTRFIGLEITIMYQTKVTTFWFRDGIADANLIQKFMETHDIEFSIGDGGALTPADGTSVYTDPALLNATLLGVWASGRKLRRVLYPATLTTADTYAQFNPNADGTNGTITLINGVFSNPSDYSFMYK